LRPFGLFERIPGRIIERLNTAPGASRVIGVVDTGTALLSVFDKDTHQPLLHLGSRPEHDSVLIVEHKAAPRPQRLSYPLGKFSARSAVRETRPIDQLLGEFDPRVLAARATGVTRKYSSPFDALPEPDRATDLTAFMALFGWTRPPSEYPLWEMTRAAARALDRPEPRRETVSSADDEAVGRELRLLRGEGDTYFELARRAGKQGWSCELPLQTPNRKPLRVFYFQDPPFLAKDMRIITPDIARAVEFPALRSSRKWLMNILASVEHPRRFLDVTALRHASHQLDEASTVAATLKTMRPPFPTSNRERD
jgi:hypothetical protein